ncbi:hypothetical protein COCON_G00000250 [Conger conger]|uniref:Uncharacterized protein n=1 Tax=Conger conger TaxID=82655 RepID=A0A9Q1E0F6_CONCO|nr:hypothetical protein COCON_G00000250 [Conger conger]
MSLRAAREVHQFDHDVDELKSRMAEMEAALDSEDHGHDLLSVQALLRQHQALQRDLATVGEELGQTREEGRVLGRRHAQVQRSLADRLEEVEEGWSSLRRKAQQRSERLSEAETAQTYLTDSRELVAWLKESLSLVRGEGLGGEGGDLEQLLTRHEEYRLQIDRQLDKSQAVTEEGRRLVEGGNFLGPEVEERLEELQALGQRLEQSWEESRLRYQEDLEALRLQRELQEAERWLSTHEAALRSQEYGDCVQDVLELMKRQEDMESTLQAQEERFSALQERRTRVRSGLRSTEQRLQELQGKEGVSRDRTARVPSLRRKPSDLVRPLPTPRPPAHKPPALSLSQSAPRRAGSDIIISPLRRSMRSSAAKSPAPSPAPVSKSPAPISKSPAPNASVISKSPAPNASAVDSSSSDESEEATPPTDMPRPSSPPALPTATPVTPSTGPPLTEPLPPLQRPPPPPVRSRQKESDQSEGTPLSLPQCPSLGDGSQYLFAAPSRVLQQQWVEKLQGGASDPDGPTPGHTPQADRESAAAGQRGGESGAGRSQTEAPHTDPSRAESHLETAGLEEGAEGSKTDREPPPKPPHTYYNKHRYPSGQSEDAAAHSPAPGSPDSSLEGGAKEKPKSKSVFKKLFKM